MAAIRLAGALLLALTGIAAAQQNYFFVERGHWWIGSGASDCRAANRPGEELNFAPFNTVEFVIKRGNALGLDLYLWPGALVAGERLELRVRVNAAREAVLLPAAALTDFSLRAEPVAPSPLLRALATAKRLQISISGRQDVSLLFLVDDGAWLVQGLIKCASLLPKP